MNHLGRPAVITKVLKSVRGRQKKRIRGRCDYGRMVREMQHCCYEGEERGHKSRNVSSL